MSSIDERIVEMRFNNGQFEAGVKATIRSLDGLKQSLKFDGAIKGLGDLGRAAGNVKVKVNTDGVAAGVKAVQTGTGSITKALGEVDAAGKKATIKIDVQSFKDGVKGVVGAAGTLKENLNFEKVSAGIKNIDFGGIATKVKTSVKSSIDSLTELDAAGKNVTLESLQASIDGISNKFSGMSVIGIAALGAIGAKAATIGAGMAKSMFVDNPKMGLAEYETNLNSVQTIMSNTQSKGSTLKDVNSALAELNTYSDQTIYNFAEMAKNVGTFTAAGVDLDTSTSAIKGIANLAATSGSNSQQASTAMYQLSQALAAGKVGLMDWNSVVTAGMGGDVFKNAIIETARNQGVAVDSIIKKNGTFRESLQEGWLTTEVMTETLSKFTGDLTDDQLKTMGYTKDQIKGIQEMAKTASDAAQKVKTFTQFVDIMGETAQSGWATSSQLILGDFEEAKAMWTKASEAVKKIQEDSAKKRNEMLADWKNKGGRDLMIESVTNGFKALMGVMEPVKKAWAAVFPPSSTNILFEITKAIHAFTEALIPGAATTSIIHNVFKLLFGVLKIGVTIIGGVFKVLGALFGAIFQGSDGVSSLGTSIGGLIGKFADMLSNSTFVAQFFDTLAKGAGLLGLGIAKLAAIIAPFIGGALTGLGNVMSNLGGSFNKVIQVLGMFGSAAAAAIGGFIAGGFETAMTRVRMRLESFGELGGMLGGVWSKISSGAQKMWSSLAPLVTAIGDMFKDIGTNISDSLKDVDFNTALDMVNVGLLGGIALLFRNFFKKSLGIGEGLSDGILSKLGDSVEQIKGVLEGVTGTLEAMQQNLQAGTLMKIALAIAILAASVVVLSLIDSAKLTKALIAIGTMFIMLNKSMTALAGVSITGGLVKIPLIAGAMLLLGGAILVLAFAVRVMSSLSWDELIKGLFGVSVMLFAVTKAAVAMSKNPANLIATGIGLIALAIAIRILASAVKAMSELGFGAMVQGLVGVGAVLAALAIFNNMTKVSKGAFANSAGLILLGIALNILASAVGKFASMNAGAMTQGLVALGGVLLAVAVFSNMTANNKNIIQAAISLGILAIALNLMATAIGTLGSLPMDVMVKGLIAMGVGLAAITLALMLVPPNMLATSIGFMAIAASMVILAGALSLMGAMSWEEIAKSMVVLTGSLVLLSAALILMTGTVAGAAALLVASIALVALGTALMLIGSLSWEQLLVGLAGLAGSLLLFGVAGLLLTPVVPTILALGIAIGALGLGLLAAGIGTTMFVAGMIALAASITIVVPAITALITGILNLIPMAAQKLGEGIVSFANVLMAAVPTFLNAMVVLIMALLKAITIVTPAIMRTLSVLITNLLNLLVRAVPQFVSAGMKIIVGVLKGVADNIHQVVTQAARVITEFLNGIANALPSIIQSGVNLIISFVNGVASAIESNSGAMTTAGLRLAGAIIKGMVNGIGQGIGSVISAAKEMASSALSAAKNFLGINSPSKEFHKIGSGTGEGMVNGIAAMGKHVAKAAAGLGQDAIDGTTKALDINSPSKEFEKLGKFTRDGFVKGLKGTKEQSKAAFTEMKKQLNDVVKASAEDIKGHQAKVDKLKKSRKDDLDSLKQAEKDRKKILKYNKNNGKKKDKSTEAVDKRIKKLKKARKDELKLLKVAEKDLKGSKAENAKVKRAKDIAYKHLQDDAKRVEALAAKRDANTKKLDDARKKLSDAKKVRDDYSASVRAQYGKVEDINENTRMKTYFENMRKQIAETKTFTTKMAKLNALGLNDTLYKELIAKGPDAMPFIDELLKGGKGKVTEFNGLQKQLDSAAAKLGKDSSTNLYQAGVNAAEGLVKGLEKERKKLETEMTKIANYMVKAMKKALGIKSPSREFAKIGSWSTQGLAKGLAATSKVSAKAAEGVGDDALSALKTSMQAINTAKLADVEMTPVIRPVLDLTDVQNKSKSIGGMLGANPLVLKEAVRRATALAIQTNRENEANNQNGTQAEANKMFVLNQYNNSPKALSPSDIYRSTKNQMSTVKEALSK